MSTRHAAVWLDHEEAKIFHLTPGNIEQSELHVAHHLARAHKRGGHAKLHRDIAEEHPFFDEIAGHLADVEEILVVGPAETKHELVKFFQAHNKDVARKIVAGEAADHPSDGQLIAHARKYFLAADRMRG